MKEIIKVILRKRAVILSLLKQFDNSFLSNEETFKKMKEVLFTIHPPNNYQIHFHEKIRNIMQKPNVKLVISYTVNGGKNNGLN
jgi:translation initiation factor 2 alpha subunit (eIF-2alpha)